MTLLMLLIEHLKFHYSLLSLPDYCSVHMQAEDYGVFQGLLVTVPALTRSLRRELVQNRRAISLILALR